jgi:predicted DsbA family dithiol-disulfide isomerase
MLSRHYEGGVAVQIEVFSDVVCPWCYVGFVRLRQALAARPDLPAEVTWLPFELNPGLPPEGRDRREYMLERFGDVDRFAAGQRQLEGVGVELGIDFQFARVTRAPNTRRAHMLLAHARRAGFQTEVKGALLEAHFSRGLDVADPAVLAGIAAACGLDGDAARRAVDDPALRSEVEALEALAHRWQVSGVPTFVFDRRQAFSGAQPLEVFLRVFEALQGGGSAPSTTH